MSLNLVLSYSLSVSYHCRNALALSSASRSKSLDQNYRHILSFGGLPFGMKGYFNISAYSWNLALTSSSLSAASILIVIVGIFLCSMILLLLLIPASFF